MHQHSSRRSTGAQCPYQSFHDPRSRSTLISASFIFPNIAIASPFGKVFIDNLNPHSHGRAYCHSSARIFRLVSLNAWIHRVEHDIVLKLSGISLPSGAGLLRRWSCKKSLLGRHASRDLVGREASISRSPEVNPKRFAIMSTRHRLWNSISAAGWPSEPRSKSSARSG